MPSRQRTWFFICYWLPFLAAGLALGLTTVRSLSFFLHEKGGVYLWWLQVELPVVICLLIAEFTSRPACAYFARRLERRLAQSVGSPQLPH